MGTNFYARIIPSKDRKEHLKSLIDKGDFDKIKEEIDLTYGSFHTYINHPSSLYGEIHLGKRSAGWKFLWNPNIHIIRNGHLEKEDLGNGCFTSRYIPDPNTAFYVYPLTKKGIKDFIDREDIEIYDEYNELQNKEDFFNDAINWVTWKDFKTGKIKEAWDSKSYHEESGDRIYSCNNELTKYLEKQGIEFISESKTDFYSDELRFATTIEFS